EKAIVHWLLNIRGGGYEIAWYSSRLLFRNTAIGRGPGRPARRREGRIAALRQHQRRSHLAQLLLWRGPTGARRIGIAGGAGVPAKPGSTARPARTGEKRLLRAFVAVLIVQALPA